MNNFISIIPTLHEYGFNLRTRSYLGDWFCMAMSRNTINENDVWTIENGQVPSGPDCDVPVG